MASLIVSSYAFSIPEVHCLFTSSEEYLPAQETGCDQVPQSQVDVTFLGDTTDLSGNNRAVTANGAANVGVTGARFDGVGDDITIANFDYSTASRAFTISFWFTKEDCTNGVYEYLFSHHATADATTWDNAYVDIYLACEEAGGGWSTATGSIMRYWLRDSQGHEAMMDYSLHETGDFDTVTNVWVHTMMVVTSNSIITYDDGVAVTVDEYGFYGGVDEASNIAMPDPGALNPPFAAFAPFRLNTDIFLGGRADQADDRHYRGTMALFRIYDLPLTPQQAQCVFREGEAMLPEPEASRCTDLALDVRFTGDHLDRSGNEVLLTTYYNGAPVDPVVDAATPRNIDEDGAFFSGDGDYFEVNNIHYADDGEFTISFWISKEACSGGIYEYMYSHVQFLESDILDDRDNSNINIYLGCEAAGGGWSTSGGTVVRFNLIDGAQHWASFDFPLHDAGNFDDITNTWLQIVLVGQPRSMRTFDDGSLVADAQLGFYTGGMVTANVAYPHPFNLDATMSNYHLDQNIIIGSRADLDSNRHFMGHLAGLQISDSALTGAEIECTFAMGEEYLPVSLTACQSTGTASVDVTFLGDSTDASTYHRQVALNGQATVGINGVRFDGDGDYVTIAHFDYAQDGRFAISFWSTKEGCTGGIYEYLYSHHNDDNPATQYDHAFINIYLACEQAGGGWSTAGGSVIRYNLMDDAGSEAMFDFALHDSGDFDSITNVWMHTVMSVKPVTRPTRTTTIETYDDGQLVADAQYGFYGGTTGPNIAQPTPSALTAQLTAQLDVWPP